MAFALGLLAQQQPSTLALGISVANAPAGGTAQIQIFSSTPELVTEGGFSIDLDPTVFGPVANAAVFSATGDAQGYVDVLVSGTSGQQLVTNFFSPSGGIAQLPGLPIFVITVPVLNSAAIGAASTISIDPSGSVWHDSQGNVYAVTAAPVTFSVGGALSIQSVSPGGGLLPSGTTVTINGTGFDASTIVTIDGVSLSSTQFVSPQQINVVLNGAYEMTARHVHVQTGGGALADFFCSLSSVPANVTTPTVLPLLPLTTYTNVAWQYPDDPMVSEYAALLNQNLSPVTVTFFSTGPSGMVTVAPAITVPPGQLYFLNTSAFASEMGVLGMLSSAPMRMLEYEVVGFPGNTADTSVYPPSVLTGAPSRLQPTAYGGADSWTWQIGAAAPPPATWNIMGSFPFTVTSSVPWLSVSPAQGTEPASFTMTPNVSGLTAGSYAGTVTITTTLPPALSAFAVQNIVIPVSIQVSASPFITATGSNYFTATVGATTAITGTISVASSGNPAQFSASVNTSSGGSWLSATPTSGTAPGSIMVSANPSGLPSGVYYGNLVIQGPANSVTIPLELAVMPPASTGPVPLSASPPSLSFVLPAGMSGGLGGALVFVQPTSNFTVSVQTQSGGNWLTTTFPGTLTVNASAVGLGPGTYLGTVTLTSASNGSLQIPVTLLVLVPASPITVTPSSLSATIQAGQSGTQSFSVSSPVSTLFNETTFEPGGQQWITQIIGTSLYTPATVTITFATPQPGTYFGSVTVTSGSSPVTIPITLTVTASAAFPPILGSIVSAASGTPSPISPGDIVSLYGSGIGSTPAGLTLTASGMVSTSLGGTQVLIDGIAAPLIYESASQVNAIVPYGVASSGVATVQVTANGLQSPTWSVPLAPAAPSIFTIGSTGVGQAAVLNQDNSVNSASNAAAKGTVVQIFATGGGQTSPASATGSLAKGAYMSLLPVTVTIGGQNAVVTYQGSAPGEVSGLLQVNAVVPAGASVGSDTLTLTINGQNSQPGVTVAIQ